MVLMPIEQAISIIQARMSSSRLPGKVLLPLGGKPVLDHVVDRCREFSSFVAVCTSVDASDDVLAAHCEQIGVLCVRGDLDDVFSRFRATLAHPQIPPSRWFYRVTADCPLVSTELAKLLVDAARDGLEYLGVAADTVPLGISAELVRRESFEKIDMQSLDAAEREHVTLRLYESSGARRCLRIAVPPHLQGPELRLTVDYPEDLALLRRLFDIDPTLDARKAIDYLREHPDVADNGHLEQKAARCG